MTDPSLLLTPLNVTQLSPLMQDLFSLDEIRGYTFVHGGYMGQNYQVDTENGVYFLKQYSNRINTVIHEIKTAEAYFAHEGLPVILPIKDRYEREAFWIDGNWYSLFPFVYGKSPVYGALTIPIVESLARMLAQFHQAGTRFPSWPFQVLRISNRRKFHMEKVELERLLRQKKVRSPLDERILELLSKKEVLVNNTPPPQDIHLPYTCLLHGDFQYLNTFVNEQNQVTHVYDLERASIGPTAYEVIRSLILTCFDDGWNDTNRELARHFLRAYREHYPLSMKEFKLALRLYTYSIMHMTWIEARYVVFGVATQLEIFERHVRRLETLSTQDQEAFCEDIWK